MNISFEPCGDLQGFGTGSCRHCQTKEISTDYRRLHSYCCFRRKAQTHKGKSAKFIFGESNGFHANYTVRKISDHLLTIFPCSLQGPLQEVSINHVQLGWGPGATASNFLQFIQSRGPRVQVIVSGVRLKLSKPAAPTETPPPAPAEKAKPSGQSDGSAGGSGNDKTGIFPM